LPEVWFVQAISAALLGRSCEAQAAFEKAVGASRNDPRVLAEYANFMATERGPKPAEEVAIRAVRAAPNGPEGWAALGLAQLRLGLKAEAESSLKRALELDPNNARAQVYMGKFLYDAGRENEAAAIAKLMQDTPGLEDLADQLAEAVRARRTAAMLARRRQFAEALAGRAGKYKNFRWLKVVLVIAAAAAAALAVLLSLRRI
jgi:Tfp pilus assembly protein PilF